MSDLSTATKCSAKEKYIECLVNNIKEKDVGITSYGNSIYSDLSFVCNKNKLCIMITPRSGCSIAFQQFLDLNGLLDDGLEFNPFNSFIHTYRCYVFTKYVPQYDINKLIEQKYTFVKFITNPYIRAVSIYIIQTSHNLSFRQYLKQLVNNEIDYFDDNDKYHLQQQYISGEENVITKYIKIDKNETYQINLFDGTLYTLDINKYTSYHHSKKNDKNTEFCGDILKCMVSLNLPTSYKYFYDDEIKKMVETFYKDDIEHYNYSFDDFNI